MINKIPCNEEYNYLRNRFMEYYDNIDIRIVQKGIFDTVTLERKMLVKVTVNDIYQINPRFNIKGGYFLIHDNSKCKLNEILYDNGDYSIYNSWQNLKLLMSMEDPIVDGEENILFPAIYRDFKGMDFCVYLRAIGDGNIPYYIYTKLDKFEPQLYCRNAFSFMENGDNILKDSPIGQRERFKLLSTFEDAKWD